MEKEIFYNSYPLVFPNREPEKGFACGNGWHQLLDSLFFVINKELEKIPLSNFRIIYIKQKYGTLRIYYENATDYIKQTIAQAEEMSAQICETCGEYGEIRESSLHIKVRCNKCDQDYLSSAGFIQHLNKQ